MNPQKDKMVEIQHFLNFQNEESLTWHSISLLMM